VTGYSRRDIIPRNCRFLQGELTDSRAPKRLRIAIDNCEETVELLLNYRKNGDPFWNLLYVAPLFNETGEVVFFLGGQINCSTTIHSRTDILKVLSVNDEELDQLGELAKNQPRSIRSHNSKQRLTPRSNFFKTFRKHIPSSRMGSKLSVRDEAGMEPGLINRLEKLNFKTQVEAFYTAYSKVRFPAVCVVGTQSNDVRLVSGPLVRPANSAPDNPALLTGDNRHALS
jgi:hypothetical protein